MQASSLDHILVAKHVVTYAMLLSVDACPKLHVTVSSYPKLNGPVATMVAPATFGAASQDLTVYRRQ